jgi:hypothetical protein
MQNVIATKRGEDYHATLESNPSIYGRGRSAIEAVGDLVIFHPEATQLFVKRSPGTKDGANGPGWTT